MVLRSKDGHNEVINTSLQKVIMTLNRHGNMSLIRKHAHGMNIELVWAMNMKYVHVYLSTRNVISTSTHNLWFGTKTRKMYTHVHPHFTI